MNRKMRDIIDLSICIVNFNVKNLLRECLNSIYQNTSEISYEVIVVDNASTDGSTEMVEKEFPQAILIKNMVNVGLAKANNQAIKKCRGRYILILNPDTIILPNSLEAMVEVMDEKPDVGISGPMILNKDESIQISILHLYPSLLATLIGFTRIGIIFDYFFPNLNYPMRVAETHEMHKIEHYVSRLTEPALMVRRKAIEEVGLMDESFFLYEEGTDWEKRMIEAGWRLFYTPKAKVIHYGGQSRSKVDGSTIMYHGLRSSHIFIKKHHGKLRARLMKVIIVPTLVLGIIWTFVASWLYPTKQHFLRGICHGNLSTLKVLLYNWKFIGK